MPTVYVVITETTTGDKNEFSIQVDPFTLTITSGSETLDIDWELDATRAPGWEFARNGVDIKGHGSKFSDRGKASGKKYGWTRRSKESPGTTKKYKYSINLENTAAGTTLAWDPYIVNN
jgi:hypothetical protein